MLNTTTFTLPSPSQIEEYLRIKCDGLVLEDHLRIDVMTEALSEAVRDPAARFDEMDVRVGPLQGRINEIIEGWVRSKRMIRSQSKAGLLIAIDHNRQLCHKEDERKKDNRCVCCGGELIPDPRRRSRKKCSFVCPS